MIDLKQLLLFSGKASWMGYVVLYHVQTQSPSLAVRILVVSLNDEGRIVLVSEGSEREKLEKETDNEEKRKLKLDTAPFSLTCILHNNYILADPTAQEESTMETLVTVVLDSFGQLVPLCKLGGLLLAHTSAVQCAAISQR
ncbi:hypothetical protein ACH5RR_002793 [Cinchona calisaya]|uniref:Exoribonuclease phosphorolytic domain-containing protein n=1 Tax=Cinchona calisaya TaxID=153742 RepID=A0ABD3ASZ7_9GENT